MYAVASGNPRVPLWNVHSVHFVVGGINVSFGDSSTYKTW